MHNIKESSLTAYDSLKSNGMAASQARILAHMQPGRLYSRREIARALDLETSSVAGRVNELIEMNQVEVCGHIKCPISRKTVEAIKLAGKQTSLFD